MNTRELPPSGLIDAEPAGRPAGVPEPSGWMIRRADDLKLGMREPQLFATRKAADAYRSAAVFHWTDPEPVYAAASPVLPASDQARASGDLRPGLEEAIRIIEAEPAPRLEDRPDGLPEDVAALMIAGAVVAQEDVVATLRSRLARTELTP